MSLDPWKVIAETRAWVDRAVIGLNLCPFAKAVQVRKQVRYVCSDARDTDALLEMLREELELLARSDPKEIETTILIHPEVLTDFIDFSHFLKSVNGVVKKLGYAGVLQVADFHPDYQFADAEADDLANATNRSPYPTLHLLREDSIDRAVAAFPEAETIFEHNIETLEKLGPEAWAELQAQCKQDAESAAKT